MRFSLRNLLICVTILFLLLPAMRPVADYIRREREYGRRQAEIERLHLQIMAKRASMPLRLASRSRLQEEELRRIDVYLAKENNRSLHAESP